MQGFHETLGEIYNIHETLGEDLQDSCETLGGFARICETLGEDLQDFMRLWERICKIS